MTIANPEISSTNRASIFINHCSLSFSKTYSFGKNSIDLFRKLKHDTFKFITPSNSNIYILFLMFSWFSDTNVNIPNLWPCTSIITGMMNNTLTYCLFPTWILWVLDVNFGNECSDLHLKNVFVHKWFTCFCI